MISYTLFCFCYDLKKPFVPLRDWLVSMSTAGVQRKCEPVALIVGSGTGNGNNQNVNDPRSCGALKVCGH